ncbi:MAG: hypothetical protein V4737_10205, partial [Curtobacterium sp.]
ASRRAADEVASAIGFGAPPEPPPAAPVPPQSEWDPREPAVEVALSATSRLIVATRTCDHRIVHYSMEHQMQRRGTWTPIARIDTSHGTVHKHTWFGEEKRTELRKIVDVDDVENSWDESYADMHDNQEDHERQARSGKSSF